MAATGYTSGDPTKMAKAANLGDVAAAAASRTNLGLGNSATLDVGTTAGTVAAGDDARFSGGGGGGAPAAHAATHAAAGTDPVTLTQAQITGLTGSLAGKSDVGHVHAGADITSGTISTSRLSVGTTSTDVAAGNDARFTTATYGGMSIPIGEALSAVISTGVIYGGTLTLNADPSKVDISSILGYIVNYHSNPLVPTLTRISLPAQIGVPMDAGSLSRLTTYWMIDSSGTLIQTGISPSRATRRSNLMVGITSQVAGAIAIVVSENDQLPQLLDQVMDLSRSLGAFLISGCSLSVNSGLTFQRAIGQVFAVGANQVTNPADPHVVAAPANNPVTFQYGTRASEVFSAPTTTIDPTHYDLADVVTAIPGSPNQATIQRIFYFAASNSTGIQYGQTLYANLDTAVQAISNGTFVANPTLADPNSQGILLGAIVLTKGCTDLTDTTAARVFTFGKFSGSVIAGGGISFGTTAGTAAEGNDSRIVGAQQRSALTTKGDLYVATSSATTTRQPVGADGQALVADSTQASGMKWAALPVIPGAFIPRAAYMQICGVTSSRTAKAVTQSRMYLVPFGIAFDRALTGVSFELTSAVVGTTALLTAYSIASPYTTAVLINSLGSFTADTGAKIQCAVSQSLTAGANALAITFQGGAPNARFGAGFNPYVSFASEPTGSGLGCNNAYIVNGVTGAAPPSVDLTTATDSDSPVLWAKF